jgi:hypothetical protein
LLPELLACGAALLGNEVALISGVAVVADRPSMWHARLVTTDTGVFAGYSPKTDDTLPMHIPVSEFLARITLWLRVMFRFVGRLGFGRQSALVGTRRMFPKRALSPACTVRSLFVGSILIRTGVLLLTQANLGPMLGVMDQAVTTIPMVVLAAGSRTHQRCSIPAQCRIELANQRSAESFQLGPLIV